VDVTTAIDRLREDWPSLTIAVHGNGQVQADARAFDVVIRNLLQNAVVHGGASRVDVHVERPASTGTVRVIVQDDGRGLPPDALKHLGEPFVRPSPTSGTGAGLYVSRRLVTRMGGCMRFGSTGHQRGGFAIVIDLPEGR
jgi:signal transduction histidine kinase